MTCKIDMYAGLLGAGKTTLINQLLATEYKGQKVAIIENEIGKINLDAGSFGGPDITVRELTGGCVCCTIKGAFSQSIDEIAETIHPDCILIEPTGAADITGIIEACSSCKHASLRRVVLVANAKKLPLLLTVVGPFYIDQIKRASCIFLNFADQMSEEKLAACIEKVREINPGAKLVHLAMAEVDEHTFVEDADANEADADEPDVNIAVANIADTNDADSNYVNVNSADTNNVTKQFAFGGRASRPVLQVEEAGKKSSRMMPIGKGKDTTIYTWSLRIERPLSDAEFSCLKETLLDPGMGDLWRVKGIVPLEGGRLTRLDLTFGDLFERSQEDADEELVGTIVLIGKRLGDITKKCPFARIG